MFVYSILSLVLTFASDKVKNITFWTMGSLAGSGWQSVLILFAALIIFGGVILSMCTELNAFAIGEDNVRNIGVNVRRVRLRVLILVSCLIGVLADITGDAIYELLFRQVTGKHYAEYWVYGCNGYDSCYMSDFGCDAYLMYGYQSGVLYRENYKGSVTLGLAEWTGDDFVTTILYEGTYDRDSGKEDDHDRRITFEEWLPYQRMVRQLYYHITWML